MSFHYAPARFERIAAEFGVAGELHTLRLPPLRAMAPLVARACGYLEGADQGAWEELSLQLAARAIELNIKAKARAVSPSPQAVARVTALVRSIEHEPAGDFTLASIRAPIANRSGADRLMLIDQRRAGVEQAQQLSRVD